jgi:hypothetical protein
MKNPILLMLMLPVMVVAQTSYFKTDTLLMMKEFDETRADCKWGSTNQPNILLLEAQPQYINADSTFSQHPGRINPFHDDTHTALHKTRSFKLTSIYIFELIPNPDYITFKQLFTLSTVPKRFTSIPMAFSLI